MAKKYISLTQLSTVFSKVKAYVDKKVASSGGGGGQTDEDFIGQIYFIPDYTVEVMDFAFASGEWADVGYNIPIDSSQYNRILWSSCLSLMVGSGDTGVASTVLLTCVDDQSARNGVLHKTYKSTGKVTGGMGNSRYINLFIGSDPPANLLVADPAPPGDESVYMYMLFTEQ